MHIVFVTIEFVIEGKQGGLGTFTSNMARIFAEKGNEVTVVMPTDKDKSFCWESGINIEYVNCCSMFNREKNSMMVVFNKMYMSYKIKKKIEEIHKIKPVSLVHYCNLQATALLPAKLPHVVRISSYRNLVKGADKKIFLPKYEANKSDISDKLEELSVKKAFAIISPSNLLANITDEHFHRKAFVLESPFWIKREDLEEKFYCEHLKDKKYILFFGRLGYLKGAHIIGKIIYDILKQNPEYYFVIVGRQDALYENGEKIMAVDYIKKQSKEQEDRIIYCRMLPRRELYPIIEHAQVCFLPSRIDNLPNACIEAMALKKIVVGTKGSSFEQLITAEYNGFLADVDDINALKEALKKALELKPDEKKQMEDNAYKTVERLNPDRVYKRYQQFYQYVIEKYNQKRNLSH